MHIYSIKSIPKPFLTIIVALALLLGLSTTALAAPTYAVGTYDLPFEVLKDNADEISATSDYMVSPAKLIVADGSMHVEVTLNNSTWWQYFKVQTASGSFVDVTTLSEDVDSNTRIVQFAVEDISALLFAKIHIIVTGIPGFEYDNTYDIRFKFDASNVPLAQVISDPETSEEASEDAPDKSPEATPDEGHATPVQPDEPELPTGSETPSEDVTPVDDEQAAQPEQSEQLDEDLEKSDDQADQTKQNEVNEASEEQQEPVEEEKEQNKSSTSTILYIVVALVVIAVIYTLIRKRKRD